MAFQGVYLLSAWSSRESEPPRNMVERNGEEKKRVIAKKERPSAAWQTRRGAEPSFRAGFKVARALLRWQPLNGGGAVREAAALERGRRRRPPFAQR